jgi:hypothetical protein
MSTITQRHKLSKGTWALIIILFAALITVAVLAFLGYISLAFIADWLTGTMLFGSTGWVNAAIVLGVSFAGGIFVAYALTKYFIGQKVTTSLAAYQPGGQNLSAQPNKDTETVIS